tara:strand:+ start:739 stop:936 length:198 start_codon:yes stop_codon:yes gene_type:complete
LEEQSDVDVLLEEEESEEEQEEYSDTNTIRETEEIDECVEGDSQYHDEVDESFDMKKHINTSIRY